MVCIVSENMGDVFVTVSVCVCIRMCVCTCVYEWGCMWMYVHQCVCVCVCVCECVICILPWPAGPPRWNLLAGSLLPQEGLRPLPWAALRCPRPSVDREAA